jgi:site-specific DNA recombinase
MSKAVIYVRVSTDQQVRDGVGLAAQEERCRMVCAARGLEVLDVFAEEGVSGRRELNARPKLKAAIDLAQASGAVLVSYSVSRIARRQRILWNLLDPEGGVRLRFVSATEPFDTSTPMGRAMMGMIGVWSQLEADLVGERTRDALSHIRASGRKLGPPTAAQKVPESAKRIVALRKKGHSLRDICDILNREGVPTARGGKWWPRVVNATLAQLDGAKSAK